MDAYTFLDKQTMDLYFFFLNTSGILVWQTRIVFFIEKYIFKIFFFNVIYFDKYSDFSTFRWTSVSFPVSAVGS